VISSICKSIDMIARLSLIFLLLLPSLLKAEEGYPPSSYNYDFRNFVAWFEDKIAEKHIPGAALAIVSREGIMQLQTWGVNKVIDADPVNADSIFRIASMSKTFAGTLTGLLIHQNLQSWDSRINDLFPRMELGEGDSSRTITLKHIISHSTGLMPHSYSNMLDDGVPYDKIKEKFNQIPTVCRPGQCYGYQNVVFSIVADVVEESTGDSYEKYLHQQIFTPLGMITASVGMESYINSQNVTSPHRLMSGKWRAATTNPAYYSVAPASGINASIFDMSIWIRANLGAFPEVLPNDFLAELHEPVISTPYGNYFNRWSGLEKAYYATGWRVFDYNRIRAVHHGGGVRGYRSEMVFVPEANVGMVMLLNAESNFANDVVPAFLDNLTDSD